MNLIRSKLLNDIEHGFGMAGYSLPDHVKGISFQTNQMHGDEIVLLSHDSTIARTHEFEADAFIANEKGIICFVRTADCVPILMYDPVKKAVAAIHAGWRGTSLNIAVKTVERMEKEFGSKRENIRAAIGPAIGGNCYEVGEEVIASVSEAISLTQLASGDCRARQKPWRARNDKYCLDLSMVNHRLLTDSGLTNIDLIPICNHCDTRFASYRRDKSEERRQVNFILLSR